jgi:hypothetical protein
LLSLVLAVFIAGCDDNVVGIEGFCPVVLTTIPANNAVNVSVDTPVSVTFKENIKASTMVPSAFVLSDGVNKSMTQASEITGSMNYVAETKTMHFVPESPLSPATTYTGRVKNTIEDPLGNVMLEDHVWTFTTEAEVILPPPGFLGTAETYGIMAKAAITNTGNSIINGDVSLEPGTSITGFPPGIINGVININNTASTLARSDLLVAYNHYKGLPPGINISAGADLGALYPGGIAPGTYTSGSTMLVSTPLVLDAGGDVNAVWVFQIGSSLTTSANIVLTGGANVNNIFWVPTQDATIGVGTTFHGTIVSGRDVTANTGAVVNGRILAGAITAGTIALDNNTINVPGFE